MTPIEVMALVFVLLGIAKLVAVFVNPRSWLKVVRIVYKIPWLTAIVALVLTFITLGYLLRELTIVQVFAVMLFVCFLMMLGWAPLSKEMIEFKERLATRATLKRLWLAIIVWIILLVWVLYAILS